VLLGLVDVDAVELRRVEGEVSSPEVLWLLWLGVSVMSAGSGLL